MLVLLLVILWWWFTPGGVTETPAGTCSITETPDVKVGTDDIISCPVDPPPAPIIVVEPVQPDDRAAAAPTPTPTRAPEADLYYACRPYRSGKSRGETACRTYLEHRFGVPFPTCRPAFLRNPETNENLELDCYNSTLRLAVEFQGPQHYQWPNYLGTRQTYEEFVSLLRRDKFKIAICDRVGVYVIRVPYTVDIKDIPAFIESRLVGWNPPIGPVTTCYE